MSPDTIQDQIIKYVTDVHGSRPDAPSQLESGAEVSGDAQLTAAEKHLTETEMQEKLVRARLDALGGASPSALEDLVHQGWAAA